MEGCCHHHLYPVGASVKQECKALDIQFHLLHGSVGEVLPGFVSQRHLGAVVTDFSPLREPLKWLDDLKKQLPEDIPLIQVTAFVNCSLVRTDSCVSRCLDPTVLSPSSRCLMQVDAHNIVPCWVASPKLEYAARTIRGKITKQLPEFLTDFPVVEQHPHAADQTAAVRPPTQPFQEPAWPLGKPPPV